MKLLRGLDIQLDKVLIINCIKGTIPVWVNIAALDSYLNCLLGVSRVTNTEVLSVKYVGRKSKRLCMSVALIASILPCNSRYKGTDTDDLFNSRDYQLSKQTVQKYLCYI